MGQTANIYVGAYLIIKNKKVTAYTKKTYCKNHPDLLLFREEEFCPKCGEPLRVLNEPKEEFTNLYRLLEDTEFEYNFTIPEYLFGDNDDHEMQLLLSENSECSIRGDLEYGGFMEIASDMPEKFLENFKTIHKNLLEFLKEKTESVKIEFGVVNYYSYS